MSKRIGLRISCRRKDDHYDGAAAPAPTPSEDAQPAYRWRAEEKYHVVARVEPSQRQKIDSAQGGNFLFPPLNLPRSARKKTRSLCSKSPQKLKRRPLLELPDEKVKESFAVVKRSENPYADFRTSMTEMIIENEMYEEADLEQLLRCFLLLNSRRHHPAIVKAFSHVWAALFSPS